MTILALHCMIATTRRASKCAYVPCQLFKSLLLLASHQRIIIIRHTSSARLSRTHPHVHHVHSKAIRVSMCFSNAPHDCCNGCAARRRWAHSREARIAPSSFVPDRMVVPIRTIRWCTALPEPRILAARYDACLSRAENFTQRQYRGLVC